MAKSDKKKISRIKVKKKLWYKVICPKIFGQKEVGESYLASPDQAIGRQMQISLREVTGNVKDQNAYIGFKIASVQNNNLQTEPISYKLTPAYVKRVVKKNTNRVDDHFILKTKDDKDFVIKVLMVTLNKTNRSVRTALKKAIHELLKEEASKSTFDGFMSAVVSQKIQPGLRRRLAKTYPLREVSFRAVILKEKKKVAVKKAVKAPKAEEVKPEAKEEVKEAPKEEKPAPEEQEKEEPKEETKSE